MNLLPCSIIFTFKKRSWFSKLVWYFSKIDTTLAEKRKVSHLALYIGDNMIAESSFGGVAIRNIKKFNTGKYDVYIGRCLLPHECDKIVSYCNESAGLIDYSYLQLFAIMFKKIFRLPNIGDVDKEGMMCVEFILNAFIAGGVNLFKSPAEVTPLDLFTSEHIFVSRRM